MSILKTAPQETPRRLPPGWWRHSYLYRLYQYPRTFLFVTGFLAANLYLNFRKVESPPFYLWDLYSMPVQKMDTFTNYVVYYNNKVLNKHCFLNPLRGILFTYNIEKYVHFSRNGLQQSPFGTWPCNPEAERRALAAFPAWLKKYAESVVDEKINRLEVYEVKSSYRPSGRLKTWSRRLVLSE